VSTNNKCCTTAPVWVLSKPDTSQQATTTKAPGIRIFSFIFPKCLCALVVYFLFFNTKTPRHQKYFHLFSLVSLCLGGLFSFSTTKHQVPRIIHLYFLSVFVPWWFILFSLIPRHQEYFHLFSLVSLCLGGLFSFFYHQDTKAPRITSLNSSWYLSVSSIVLHRTILFIPSLMRTTLKLINNPNLCPVNFR